jgi:hypothetical protein
MRKSGAGEIPCVAFAQILFRHAAIVRAHERSHVEVRFFTSRGRDALDDTFNEASAGRRYRAKHDDFRSMQQCQTMSLRMREPP